MVLYCCELCVCVCVCEWRESTPDHQTVLLAMYHLLVSYPVSLIVVIVNVLCTVPPTVVTSRTILCCLQTVPFQSCRVSHSSFLAHDRGCLYIVAGM